MSKVLIINEAELKERSVIEHNVDGKQLSKVIYNVQEVQLRECLGKDLYDFVLTDILNVATFPDTATLSDKTKGLLNYIKPFLIYATLAEWIELNNYKLTNKGVLKLNDQSASAANSTEIENARHYYANYASSYKKRLVDYMRLNGLITRYTETGIQAQPTGWFINNEPRNLLGNGYGFGKYYEDYTYNVASNPEASIDNPNGDGGTGSSEVSIPVFVKWANVTEKPTSFPADWNSITNIPTSFTPSAHTHAIADVTGLQAALDGKQNAISFGSGLSLNNGVVELSGALNTDTVIDGQSHVFILSNMSAFGLNFSSTFFTVVDGALSLYIGDGLGNALQTNNFASAYNTTIIGPDTNTIIGNDVNHAYLRATGPLWPGSLNYGQPVSEVGADGQKAYMSFTYPQPAYLHDQIDVYKVQLDQDGLLVSFTNTDQGTVLSNIEALTVNTGGVSMASLAGTGSRMVIADSTGKLSTQDIPTGGGGSYTFGNGLTMTDQAVTLGGSLTADTTIDASGFAYQINEHSGSNTYSNLIHADADANIPMHVKTFGQTGGDILTTDVLHMFSHAFTITQNLSNGNTSRLYQDMYSLRYNYYNGAVSTNTFSNLLVGTPLDTNQNLIYSDKTFLLETQVQPTYFGATASHYIGIEGLHQLTQGDQNGQIFASSLTFTVTDDKVNQPTANQMTMTATNITFSLLASGSTQMVVADGGGNLMLQPIPSGGGSSAFGNGLGVNGRSGEVQLGGTLELDTFIDAQSHAFIFNNLSDFELNYAYTSFVLVEGGYQVSIGDGIGNSVQQAFNSNAYGLIVGLADGSQIWTGSDSTHAFMQATGQVWPTSFYGNRGVAEVGATVEKAYMSFAWPGAGYMHDTSETYNLDLNQDGFLFSFTHDDQGSVNFIPGLKIDQGGISLPYLAGSFDSKMVVVDSTGRVSAQAIPAYNFANGLSFDGTSVTLGGALTQDTIIDAAGKHLTISTSATMSDYSDGSGGADVLSIEYDLFAGDNDPNNYDQIYSQSTWLYKQGTTNKNQTQIKTDYNSWVLSSNDYLNNFAGQLAFSTSGLLSAVTGPSNQSSQLQQAVDYLNFHAGVNGAYYAKVVAQSGTAAGQAKIDFWVADNSATATNGSRITMVDGSITLASNKVNIKTLPTYADDTSAATGGLGSGDLYKTSTGQLMVKL